ncbi:MAG: hypothetical protein MJ078_08790, partial [Clostridia bacterium]|nr:hypothetical protein [Clostridia bacterium]
MRISAGDEQVTIPERAVGELPVFSASRQYPDDIAPGWSVFGIASGFFRQGYGQYFCRRENNGWRIRMKGPKRCTLRLRDV